VDGSASVSVCILPETKFKDFQKLPGPTMSDSHPGNAVVLTGRYARLGRTRSQPNKPRVV